MLFNFKSEHNQKVFHEISSDSEKLRNSFKLNQDLQQQATIFEKSLNNVFFQSFQNIRCKKRKVENPEIDGLIQKRKKLKEEVKNPLNRRAQADLEIVEKTIANLVSDKNRDKVEKIFRNVSNSNNSCNTIGL